MISRRCRRCHYAEAAVTFRTLLIASSADAFIDTDRCHYFYAMPC